MKPLFRGRRTVLLSAALIGALATGAVAATHPWQTAGPKSDGTAVTPLGFKVTPAGQQTNLGDLPLNSVPSPDGRWLVTTNDGQGAQSLQVVDTQTGKVTQTIRYDSPEALFTGLAFAKDGKTLYASAGGNNKIRTFAVADGVLTERAPIVLPTTSQTGKALNPYPAGVAVTPDGGRLLVADRLAAAVTSIDLRSGAQQSIGIGPNPFAVTVSPDGSKAWATEQGGNGVSVLDLSGGKLAPAGHITVGTHPNAATLDRSGKHLFVANGDSDEISVVDTAKSTVDKTFSVAPYQGAQVGSNPDALALSSDEKTLYVANSGNNDVAVLDVASGSTQGLIPTAWYPTSVVPVGGKLFVTNAKGLGAGPNTGPGQPNPTDPNAPTPDKYAGSMIVGTLSSIPAPANAGELQRYTEQVRKNDGFDEHGEAQANGQSPIVPTRPGQQSPIKHVIYVVKENRTFDQEFGSLGKGNGDPKVNLFGDDSAPNARALQKKFVTLDNFYADAEISAQGWNWTVAANSNPYAEQGWPANYSDRNHPYPSENGDPAIAPNKDPKNAYIWDRLANANIPFRNYGFYVNINGGTEFHAQDPKLEANTDHNFRGFNMKCPDAANTFKADPSCTGAPRIEEWKKEFSAYEKNNNLPTAEFLRLPSDHTAATKPGAPTPQAYVADNDYALGQLVDTVSHSKYWQDTAIFVTEDDAQDGPDHVDAHRTISQVISPYTQTGKVDSTFYSTASMLRTIESLVGVSPLTQFDTYATPMSAAFAEQPNAAPYTAVKPSYPFTAVNGANAPQAMNSAAQDLSSEDKINEQVFNQAIWESVHGAGSPMPAPQHALRSAATPNPGAGQPAPAAGGDTDG